MYSPDLAGVKLLIAVPPSTVKNNRILDKLLDFNSILNFIASKFQFRITIKNTLINPNG
jgi:hypothetical protein